MAVSAQQQQQQLPPNVDSFFGAVTREAGNALQESVRYTSGFNQESGAAFIGRAPDNLNRVPLREISANKPGDFDSKLFDTAEGQLLLKGGTRDLGQNTIYATVAERNEKERREDEQKIRNVAATAMAIGSLSEFLDFQRSMMAAYPAQEIKADQMMYVDAKSGKMVPAGTPGAEQVATREEKAAIEAKGNQCFMAHTAEDITKMPDGRVLNVNDASIELAMNNRMSEMEQAIKDMEAGKTGLKDYPEDMQQSIAYWQDNKKELMPIMDKPLEERTFEERMRIDTAREAFLGDDKPKMDMWAAPTLQSVSMYDPAEFTARPNAAPQGPQLSITTPAPAPPTAM